MSRKHNQPDNAAQAPEDLADLSPEETRQMLHELQVCQIELGMQNEELRAAQENLEASRSRYFDLYDLAPVGYITVSEKGLILEANLTAATMLGMARGALVNRPISQFILKEDQDINYLHRKLLFETGEQQAYDLRMINNDGTSFWVHLVASVVKDADGAPVIRVVMSNISDRKLAEEAVLDSEKRFRAAFIGSPMPLVISTQEDGIWIDVNQASLDMFGYTREEVIGKSALTTNLWVNQNDRQKFVAAMVQNGEVRNQNVQLRHKDGRLIIASVSANSLTLKGVKHILFVTEDITDRKQVEAEREKLLLRLNQAQKMEAIGSLAGGIAHDLSNMMAVMIGNLETALRYEIPDSSPSRETLTDALDAGLRAKDLIRQLRDFARKSHEAIAPLPLSILVKETLKTLHFQSITVAYDIVPDLEPVMADVTQIHQLLICLIDNAAQSMGYRGGRLQVTLKQVDITPEKAGELKLSSLGPFKTLVVAHADIPESEHQKPLSGEPVENPNVGSPETPLGFDRVLSIVQHHNAAIEIERIAGNGSRVTVYFPVIRKTGKS